MTTQSGWEPRPGPTRGETARRAPRGAAGGWPDDPARRRPVGPPGPGRPDPRPRDPRGRDPRTGSGWGGPGDRGRGGPRPPRSPRERPGDGASGGSGAPLRFIGAMSTRNALLTLVAATVIGIVATLVAGSEPGFLLSLFIIAGALVATLGVRPGAVYLLFPLPAFAFFAGAVITGKIHDGSLSSSTAGLAARLHAVDRRDLLPDVRGHGPRPGDRRRPLAALPPARRRPVPDVGGPPRGLPRAAPAPGGRPLGGPERDQEQARPASGQCPLARTPTTPVPLARPAMIAIPGTIPGPQLILARPPTAGRRTATSRPPPRSPRSAPARPTRARPGRATRAPSARLPPPRPSRPPRDPWDQR